MAEKHVWYEFFKPIASKEDKIGDEQAAHGSSVPGTIYASKIRDTKSKRGL
jgi:hypothetical protein